MLCYQCRFAKLFFDCKAKGALLGSLFISVSDTAADFIVVIVLGIVGGDIKTYRSSVYAYLLMVLLSKSVLFVLNKGGGLCGIVSARQKVARIPAFLLFTRGVHSYSLYVLDNLRAL